MMNSQKKLNLRKDFEYYGEIIDSTKITIYNDDKMINQTDLENIQVEKIIDGGKTKSRKSKRKGKRVEKTRRYRRF